MEESVRNGAIEVIEVGERAGCCVVFFERPSGLRVRGFQGRQRGVTKWVASACAGTLVEREVWFDCEQKGGGVKDCATLRICDAGGGVCG